MIRVCAITRCICKPLCFYGNPRYYKRVTRRRRYPRDFLEEHVLFDREISLLILVYLVAVAMYKLQMNT